MRIRLALFVFAFCIAGALTWQYAFSRPPSHIVVALDRSLSVERNCAGIVKASERMLSQDGIREGSSLTLLGLGTSRINPEPQLLLDRPVPIEPDGVFGKDEGAFERKRQAFLADLRKACETAPSSKESPVLALVRRGIAHLRSRGCALDGRCAVVAHSDLEDDVDARLRVVIQKAALNRAIELPAELAGSVDNAGINIHFCGTSEVHQRRTGRHASPETLSRLWKGLFTHPDLVSFQSYCGQ